MSALAETNGLTSEPPIPPPPPPPPPPARRSEPAPEPDANAARRAIAERWREKQPVFRRGVAIGAGLLGVLYLQHITSRPVVVDDTKTIAVVNALLERAKAAQPATIVRTGPMAWVGGGCRPNANALGLVGADPNQPNSFEVPRGTKVEDQVKVLLANGATLAQLRVTTDVSGGGDARTAPLKVIQGGTDGVPLFDCVPPAKS